MPYHSLALGKSWSVVEPNTQTLILALMRVAGGGFLATGLIILILLAIPFRAGERPRRKTTGLTHRWSAVGNLCYSCN